MVRRPRRASLLRPFAAVAVILLAAVGITTFTVPQPAVGLSGGEFNPGFIISDDLFYDSAAMSATQIQSFLNGQIGTCLTERCLNVAVVPVPSQAAYTSTTTGQLVCSAISGGNLAVAELIYRVQTACGISAKVILVTLQKEQGLVTSRAPSDWALKAAMGMGCPDTAACDSAFSGLATQIMSGTRQLKIYKAARFARQPGVQFVQYHPNSGCGGTSVNVQNYATAALYSYTPYQPNAAALANLGGTGDGCSSYGNRNFWRFYNDWFGPTTEVPCTVNPSGDIIRFWEGQGGLSGALDSPVNPGIVAGPGGVTVGHYANGDVYCTPRVGAVAVLGNIRGAYSAQGGPGSPLGAPLSAQGAFSAGGVIGVLQEFKGGTMLSSPETGTFAVLHGAMRSAWGGLGGSGGSLGWPTGNQESVLGGVRQQFQHGLLMVPTGQPAIVLTGQIGRYWSTGSNAVTLGSPISVATAYTAGGVTGTLQYFEKGLVMSAAATGTFSVLSGPIRNAWGALGGSGGSLGWPTGDQQAAADGYQQHFQRGTVFASVLGVGGTMTGAIATYWGANSNAVRLGYPTAEASAWVAGGVSGTLQYFERGMVLSSAVTGTFSVLNGPIRDAWGARGGSGGDLGWPTGDQEIVSGELRQKFQRGVLTTQTGLTGDIADYVGTGSNASRLGSPTSTASAWTAGGVSGFLQYFQRGMVLSSVATGTFSVLTGPIRNAWGDEGGSGGSLGWPTGDQETVAGEVRQQFQRGTVLVPNGQAGVALSGPIAQYWAAGSNGSLLGGPTSSPIMLTASGVTGSYQNFKQGMVLTSTTLGTFAVLNGEIRAAWGAVGGSGGTLGWPTADQETITAGLRQQFQYGVVVVPTGGTGVVLSGAIGTYWSMGPNASLLGVPTGSPKSLTAGGVTGTSQVFERATVFSSATTGTFAVLNGSVRSAWDSSGGSGGSLGWPTGDQVVVGGIVRQPFRLGTLGITPGGQSILLTGAYYSYWSAGSNTSLLGQPTASPITWTAGGTSGSYQVFDKAMVMSSATTGTFAVLNGPIRSAWGALDGSGGSLGWPIGDQQDVPEGLRQQFQHGAVVVPTTGDPYIVMD